jgi:helix-turn-helix protein
MGGSDYEAALAVVKATSTPIHDIGTAIYLSPDTFGMAAEWGWSNPISFYFAGRGGMLGDVNADVAQSALGWFAPAAVQTMYTEGVAVAGAIVAAERMAEAHAAWGRKHLAGVEDLHAIVGVTEELVDGLEGSALPLFVGWRSASRAGEAAGRLAQLIQILREWRGGIHLVATTAVGLTPMEAILTNEGEGQAKFFGWSAPFPDCTDIRHKHQEAEDMTDQRSAEALVRALGRDKFDAFERGVAAVRAVLP